MLLLANFLLQLGLNKKKPSFVGEEENRCHSPTEQIISSKIYCQTIKSQPQVQEIVTCTLLAVH